MYFPSTSIEYIYRYMYNKFIESFISKTGTHDIYIIKNKLDRECYIIK